jgi:hypothetical protein
LDSLRFAYDLAGAEYFDVVAPGERRGEAGAKKEKDALLTEGDAAFLQRLRDQIGQEKKDKSLGTPKATSKDIMASFRVNQYPPPPQLLAVFLALFFLLQLVLISREGGVVLLGACARSWGAMPPPLPPPP